MDATTIIWIAAGFFILCGMGMGGYFVWLIRQYKHVVIAFQIAGGSMIPVVTKARMMWDSQKRVNWYKVRGVPKIAREMQAPPDHAIFPLAGKRANMIIAFMLQSGEYFFLQINPKIREIPQEMFKTLPKEIVNQKDPAKRQQAFDKWQATTLESWKKKEGVDLIAKPISTNQRITHAQQIEKANEGLKVGMLQYVMIGGVIFMLLLNVITISILVIFWQDLTKPSMEHQTRELEITRINQQIAIQQAETIKQLETLNKGTPVQKIPNQNTK